MQLPGWTLAFSFSVLALLGSACGEVAGMKTPDGGDVDPNADFTLSVDPTSLTIPIAGSAKVTVTVARTGTTGDITLSASGLGSNLTAEFSPAAIPQGETTSEVTITVKGGTPAASSTVTLTGTAGDKTHSAEVSVTSTTITVIGTVRGNRPGVKVGLIGKASITSGAGGVFTFTDVTPPYDLYTIVDSGCTSAPTPTVFFFDDLTRPDPIVTAAAAPVTCTIPPLLLCTVMFPCPASSVSGTKSGAGNNTDPVVFAFTGGGISATLNANGSYSGTVSWGRGNTTTNGQVHALQFTRKPSGAPNTFLGYVRTGNVEFEDGVAEPLNLTFSAVNSVATLTGTVNPPQGYNAANISMRQEFGSAQQALWSTTTTNTVDATIPLIAQAGGTNLYVTSSHPVSGTSSYVVPLTGNTTVNFDMPAAAVLAAPLTNATGVTTTTMFQWTAPAGVISEMTATATTTTGTARAVYHVVTTNTAITLPVIGELPLPAGQSFSWNVVGYGPNENINEAAAANELETVSSSDYSGAAHAFTRSETRLFTTQ
jgi:hypothetical protein